MSYLCVRGRSARAAEDVDVIAALNSAVSVRPAVALSTRHGWQSAGSVVAVAERWWSERGGAWRSELTWSQEAKTASGRPQLSYSPALTAGRTARRSRRIVSASAVRRAYRKAVRFPQPAGITAGVRRESGKWKNQPEGGQYKLVLAGREHMGRRQSAVAGGRLLRAHCPPTARLAVATHRTHGQKCKF